MNRPGVGDFEQIVFLPVLPQRHLQGFLVHLLHVSGEVEADAAVRRGMLLARRSFVVQVRESQRLNYYML